MDLKEKLVSCREHLCLPDLLLLKRELFLLLDRYVQQGITETQRRGTSDTETKDI